jgi:hypothetical protein
MAMTTSTVGASLRTRLGLQRRSHPAGHRHPAQHREDGGRVGRRGDRAQQDGDIPGQSEHQMAEQPHQTDRDADPDGRQQPRHRQCRLDRRPLRGQAALGQNEHQGRESQAMGQRGVVELDAEAQGPQQHADQQEQQQGRKPEPGTDPRRECRQQCDRSPDQEVQVEDRHRLILPPRPPGPRVDEPFVGQSVEHSDVDRTASTPRIRRQRNMVWTIA